MHHQAVDGEADGPDDEVRPVEGGGEAVFFEDEVGRQLHGDHGREHAADDVEEAHDVVHVVDAGADGADDGGDDAHSLAAELLGEALAGDAGAEGVQEGCGDGGEYHDEQRGDAEAGLEHDLGNVAAAGVDGRAHADDVHPAAYEAIGDGAGQRGAEGLVRLARVVADDGQPAERHGHGVLHRHAEGDDLAAGGAGVVAAEHDHAQHHGEDEEQRHGDLVQQPQVGDADGDPDDDHHADDDAPDGYADIEDAVGGQRAVIDHDARPADELHHIQEGEEHAALGAEAHLHGLHRALALAAADQAGEEKEHAADDVAEQDGRDAAAHAEGGEIGAGEYLRQGDAGAEPDEAVLECRSPFHAPVPPINSLFRSNMWSMGPEPCPRSSMAESAPEI